MVKFVIRAGDFKKFLDTISCKGTLQFKSKGKVDAELFSAFFINVKDKKLEVLTVDTFFNQIKQKATINAVVKEEGKLEITNKSDFDEILKSMDKNYPITISSDGKVIRVENDYGDWYEMRIIGNESLSEIDSQEDSLKTWDEAHSLTTIDGAEVWKFTIPAGTAVFPMRIKTNKKSLKKFVSDTIKLTKDDSTVIISEDGKINIYSGKPNSLKRSGHKLEHENIGTKVEHFAVKFAALQSIVPNLLDDVILSFRKTGMDTIVMLIESSDKNMKQFISIASQDKDGVIWDEEEAIV